MRSIRTALGLLAGCWTADAAAPHAARPDFLYTEASRFEPSAPERFPAGARLMAWTRGAARPLAPDFAASADAAVSFDATRVLFSGKRTPADPWRIWELPLAGGPARAVSPAGGDCLHPLYLPLRKLAYGRRTPAGFHIEAAPLAGGTPSRLSFAPGRSLPAAVLRDGRILFEAGDLFTVYSDGSGVESYRCDHGPARFAASQLESGDIFFETAAGLGRFTSARAVQVEVKLPPGEYFGPVAELDGRWLISCRTAVGNPVGICAVPGDGAAQPPSIVVPGSARAGAWQPVPIVVRAPPPYHPSSLGEASGSRLLCLNAYASQAGPLPDGSIAAVRLWSRNAAGEAMTLGESAVEPDGSFYIHAPADRPLRFELLDRSGRTLRTAHSWFWTRHGEQRVCVGCHTGPARAPENRAPRVLERTQTAVPLGVSAP
jgi:hypothetical protein